MKPLSVAGAFAVAMAFGTGIALAQSVPHIGDGSNSRSMSTKTPGYSVGTDSAHISDGSSPDYLKNKHSIQIEPGYSIGTGSAQQSATSTYNQKSTGQNTAR
jgi:hypothetical protein